MPENCCFIYFSQFSSWLWPDSKSKLCFFLMDGSRSPNFNFYSQLYVYSLKSQIVFQCFYKTKQSNGSSLFLTPLLTSKGNYFQSSCWLFRLTSILLMLLFPESLYLKHWLCMRQYRNLAFYLFFALTPHIKLSHTPSSQNHHTIIMFG